MRSAGTLMMVVTTGVPPLARLMRGMAGIRWRVSRKRLITFTELGVEAIRYT